VASRSRHEGPRPLRRAARFVARLLPRSLRPGRPGSAGSTPGPSVSAGRGPSVGAGLTGGMRVRAPWSLMRWYEAFRHGTPASSATPSSSPPSRVPGRPLVKTHSLPSSITGPLPGPISGVGSLAAARVPLTVRRSLIGPPPGGPDVRPGHDLAMAPGIGALRPPRETPAGAVPPALPPSASRGSAPRSAPGMSPGGAPATGTSASPISAPGISGSGISVPVISAPGVSGSGVSGSGISALGVSEAGVGGFLAGHLAADGPVARAAGAGGPTVHGDGLPGMAGFGPGGFGPASLARRFAEAAPFPASAGEETGHGLRPAFPSSPGFAPGQLGRRGAQHHGATEATSRRGDLPGGRPSVRAVDQPAVRSGAFPGAGRGDHRDAPPGVRRGADGNPLSDVRRGGDRHVLPGVHHGEPLAGSPVAGPVVSDPAGTAGMRVLGAASLPPGNVPDPTGAVTVGPAVGHEAGSAARAVAGRTPRERWESSVASRPLEAPRQLPAAFHAMASAITGRARAPLFTTGPNTRHALAAAGALGATTGAVVHLPAVPTSGPEVSAVLAHELTHTRSPVRRPRFLLDGASALLDDDERQALAAGRDRLSGLGQSAASGLGQSASGLGQSASGLGQSAAAGLGQSASGLGRSVASGLGQAAGAGAGIVDSLPVGGGGMGAVSEVATRAARAAVIEAAGSPMGSAFSGMAGDAVSGLPGAAGSAMSGVQSAAAGAAGAAGDVLDGAAGAVSDAAGGVSNIVGGVTSGAGGGGGAPKPLDPDQVIEIVERRLLREIERRGGRWAGMF
jgi:hypothetical protein